MIWIAAACLLIGVLLIVVAPLISARRAPSVSDALQKQKLRIADELANLASLKAAGQLNAEEYTAQQRSLESEALALLESAKQAQAAEAPPNRDRKLVHLLSAALIFVLGANVAVGIYFASGTWKSLVGNSGGESANGGGAPPMMGGGGAPDPAAMVAKLEKRLAENPNDAKGQALLGRSYMVLERFADSVKAYQKAVELAPEDLDAQVGLGVATIRTGDAAAAERLFDAILKKDPASTDGLWFKGMLQVHRKDAEGAKKTYARLLEVTPAEQRAEQQAQIEQVLEMLKKKPGLPD